MSCGTLLVPSIAGYLRRKVQQEHQERAQGKVQDIEQSICGQPWPPVEGRVDRLAVFPEDE